MNNEKEILTLLLDMQKEMQEGFSRVDERFKNLETELSDVKEQLKENTDICQALMHNSEVMNAKIDGITIDHAKTKAKVSTLEAVSVQNWQEILELKQAK